MGEKNRPKYVVDTNVLIDYVDIIPNGTKVLLNEPTVDLRGSHLVIPTAVIRELSSFKREKSERGKAARKVLKRIRELSEGKIHTMKNAYQLEEPIEVEREDMLISILPVHTNFKKALPFRPSEDDMDGQIILATLSVMFLESNNAVDGTANYDRFIELQNPNVTLLTNDNGLAIRARERGIFTSRYGYKYPKPYTGRRDLVVPKELYDEFLNSRFVPRTFFEEVMPEEPPLVANEFIVMSLSSQDESTNRWGDKEDFWFANVGRFDRDEDAIVPLKHATNFPVCLKNPGQAIYAEALMDQNFAAVICTGPAGSGKTYMPTVYGYRACQDGQYIGVTIIPCENQSKLGALPGELNDKMSLDIQIIKNALRNYLIKEDSKLRRDMENLKKFGTGKKARKEMDENEDGTPSKRSIKSRLEDRVDLIWDNWFSCIPVENARGRDFSHELAFYDEFQDQNVAQADTLLKRIGQDGKIIIAGDLKQQRAPYLDQTNNGLVYATSILYDNPLVARVNFTEDEVLVRLIATRQESRSLPSKDNES